MTMGSKSATPTYQVPAKTFVSIEHPCIVKDLGKGISMLGGSDAIKQILEPGSTSTLGLSFHPDDPDDRPVLSLNNQTNNLLLRITVPKRTGKRKRGSEEPFQALDATDSKGDAHHVLQSLQSNLANSKVEALGTIESSHIWRSMPDFAYSTKGSEFLSKVKSDMLPRDLASMKRFDMHRTYDRRSTEAVPPPVLSTVSLPQQYSYRQSVHAKNRVDPETGESTLPLSEVTTNLASILGQEEAHPTGSGSRVPSLASQVKALDELQVILTDLFNQRPIWTRRALINSLPNRVMHDKLRVSLGRVAFVIHAGPWRDCICRIGVDPRNSPKYRKYQTIMIQVPRSGKGYSDKATRSSDWAHSDDKTSHIFTGKPPLPQSGSLWQLCDIEDPQLKALVDIDESQLRHECETNYFGWYQNGTMSKIRTAMKAKLEALTKGEQLDDKTLERFLMLLPNHLQHFDMNDVEVGNPSHGYLPSPMTDLEAEMAREYRGLTRYGVNKALREAPESREPMPQDDRQFPENDSGDDAGFRGPLLDGRMSQEAPARG